MAVTVLYTVSSNVLVASFLSVKDIRPEKWTRLVNNFAFRFSTRSRDGLRTFDDFDFRIEYYRRGPQVPFDFVQIVDIVEN